MIGPISIELFIALQIIGACIGLGIALLIIYLYERKP